MNDDGIYTRFLWPLLASAAGAITALSFRPWRDMTPAQIVMALFVGASFAFFVSPLILNLIFGKGPVDARQLGAVYYVMATGSNALIPAAVKWLGLRAFGKTDDHK